MDSTAPPTLPPPNAYYRTPAQASMDAMAIYQSSLPRVSSSLKPRADGRKKFTTEQTQQMEMLFRDNTHPSREQRLQLAASFDVGEKSIGIWFQNRRQAVRRERKLIESKSESSTAVGAPKSTAGSSTGAGSSRPTLEHVASEHQLPTPKARSVFNASYHPDHVPHIWGHMMSSPSPPRVSPPRAHPYPRPRTNGNANTSSDVESDSQYSVSTRAGSTISRNGTPSSSLSRTRSVSPTRPAPRSAENSLVRAHSDIGAQRTARTTATATRSSGRTRAATSNASGRVTLEWACANATRLPSSPLRPSEEQEESGPQTAKKRKGSGAKLDDVEEDKDEDMREDNVPLLEGDGEEDGDITETEADVDGHTEISISEDMEAITPSEGRSMASVDIASTSSAAGNPWSPRGSFSSSETAVSSGITGMGGVVTSKKMAIPGGVSRTKSHDREDPSAWLMQGSGRTVKPKTKSKAKNAGNASTAPVSVPNSSAAAVMPAFASSSPNSPQEIEAALALCGLFASGHS